MAGRPRRWSLARATAALKPLSRRGADAGGDGDDDAGGAGAGAGEGVAWRGPDAAATAAATVRAS